VKLLRLSRVTKIDRYNAWVLVSGEERFAHVRRRVLKDTGIYPGDWVWITEVIKDREYAVERVIPRKNLLARPTVANVSKAVYVHTFKMPPGNLFYLDLFLLNAVSAGIEPFLVVNKIDLLGDDERREAEEVMKVYEDLGYKVLWVSAETGEGLDDLKEVLRGGTIVFAGMSGVGKSSLINALYGLNLRVGEVSEKLGRGRHTTTYSKLIPVGEDTYVVDTPGFSLLEIPPDLTLDRVSIGFPEIAEREHLCAYPGCSHIHEPGCAVIEAVQKGEIAPWRYEHYVRIYEEIKLQEERRRWLKRKRGKRRG